MVALVDDQDYDWLNQWSWHIVKGKQTYYAAAYIDKRYIRMHRLILGVNDSKILGDHVDRNGLNNQRNNLREANVVQSNCNRSSHKGSSSKYLGVSRLRNLWRACIKRNYKQVFIGTFKTEEDAALAYNQKALEFHGEFANINKL